MEVFKDYAYYYNLFYKDKDYEKEAFFVHQYIKEYCENYDSLDVINVIDMGCGTGLYDKELCKLDARYCIHGIDLSETMISIAKQRKEDACSFEVADIRNFQTVKKYDVAISLFHVMSYQCTNEDLMRAFATAYDSLNDGGIFVFDAWYGPGVLSDKPSVRVKRVQDKKNWIIRNCEPMMYPNDNLVDVNYDIYVIDKHTNVAQNIQETHRMRYFFRPEIECFLNNVGFTLKLVADCQNYRTPTFDSWTVYFIAIKVG